MEWLDKKGISHHVVSCHCWRCHVFRLTGLVSGGRLVESESRLDRGGSKLSTELEVPQEARVAETATALAFRRRWLILGVVLVGSFMAILDVFIVTQGLPSIKATLGAGVADLELVVSAYSLVYAVFLVTGGRLGDILGRKWIFLFGMTVFTVASALAGYAPSAVFLIGARALQGLGAALMYPQVLSIIQVTFKGSERSLALGLFAAISGIGAITGNIVGGLLIQLNLAGLAWRPIFLVNVPVGIIGVVAGLLVLHPSRTERAPKLDLPGVGLISLFLVSLILPLAEGQQIGWPNWMVMLLALSFPVLALFVIYERKRTNKGEDPLVDMDLFKHRSFAVGIPLTLLYYVTASGLFFTLVLFLQSGLGFSPIISGLSFAQLNIGFITASLLGPRLIGRFGNRVLSLAYILQTAGLGWIILALNSYGIGLTLYELSPPLIVFGAGAGFALSPLLGVILSGVPSQEAGEASGVVSTSFQIGNTVGISLFGLLYYRFLNGQQSPTSYIDAFKMTVPYFVILSVAGFLLVFLLSQHRVRQIVQRLEV
ncbi:MFS transporter [Candidatus Bathyarchaeota archaeon]|nr:MAG: MFS transporter [Candidatus Bathyarchaeota archaeon]